KIADALTLKPRADIEDDQVFGTKPQTVLRTDFTSSDSEDEACISDFRKRNVNLLSEISKKYEGQIVSRKELDEKYEDSSYSGDDTNQMRQISVSKSSSEDDESSETEQNLGKYSKKYSEGSDKSCDDSESEDGAESEDYSITQFKKQLENYKSDEERVSNADDKSDNDENGFDMSQMEEPLEENFEHLKKQNISEDSKKGLCVRNQLLVWESLLEMRIHLQRCMTTANQMPLPDTHKSLQQNKTFFEECDTTKSNISNLLEKFLALQNILMQKFPETKSISVKQNSKEITKEATADMDEEIPSDTDNEEIPSDTDGEIDDDNNKTNEKNEKAPTPKKRKLDDYEKEMSTSHKAFKLFRDTTIQKWNEKTRLATATNMKNTPTNTILQQISYILSDRQKLLRKTQLKRSEYDIVGYEKPVNEDSKDNSTDVNPGLRNRKENDEYIPEIFDDSDFYHQLLRELIECKSADISDPVQLSRQWIALQQMRSKMKRKVDTKATKGRKIKYVVHNQLVNFMAPEKSTTWDDESTNELFKSLFGKMFEQNNVGVADNMSNIFKSK
ncbi:hypothetical protein ACJJTC_009571, partial [Scirpophaga incertulas]